MKSQRTDACGCDRRHIFPGDTFQRRNFRPELKYLNFEASSRNSGQSALEFRSRSWKRKSLRRNGNFIVKVTELREPTGDVINPNTRASLGMCLALALADWDLLSA
ncbi:hypothetical protein EYF80_039271 [Liparis tanakae]|uniref:Uncharacterized protein n=1 Tax=Liparis tanakae TaxID=230148 RepID=A0A4Z2GCZ0_9TELE|nr:hypothetical protein EYF80_039271 [Liparis tanakae]